MDGIQDLVRSVVRQCASRGVSVSEVLAAFVARTVSYLSNFLKQELIDVCLLSSLLSMTETHKSTQYIALIVSAPWGMTNSPLNMLLLMILNNVEDHAP